MDNNVIIGTAGHVDHGKTCLIKALTGIDTDRLKEEKKRGITIELGFAHLDFSDGRKVGIIDVPGHEKFVKNMLAGAGGIDIALLIVAANEGIMPQTREHMEILRLLDIRSGVIALTKADTVDSEWMEMVKEDIRELTAGSFLEGAPIIETSVYTNIGIDQLRETLHELVTAAGEKDLEKPFRLPIDRIFSVDGFGTVVTGTLVDGRINKGDTAEIYTPGLSAKVRNLQVHDQDVDTAFAGQRVAVNLAGVKKDELQRGFVVAAPDAMENTYIVDVRLDVLKETGRTVKNGSRLHFYHGARDILCKVVLLDREEVKSGESAFAQLRLEEEVALRYQDRYIVRFYSPLETVGGGIILNPNPIKHAGKKQEILDDLAVLQQGDPAAAAAVFIKLRSRQFPSLDKIRKTLCLTPEKFDAVLKKLTGEKRVLILDGGIVISGTHYSQIADSSKKILSEYHKKNVFKKGMSLEEYKSRLVGGLSETIGNSLIDALNQDGAIALSEGLVKAPGFEVAFDEGQKALADKIAKVYLDAGVLVPTKDEVLSGFKEKAAPGILAALVTDGTLVMIDKQMLFHRTVYDNALEKLRGHIAEHGQITLGEFRDILGASRKYAVAILEYLDTKKITKKVGDGRVLL